MVKVVICKENDIIKGVRSEGHSGYAKAGSDIVCAAVSILMINTANSIETFTDDCFSCISDEKKAVMDIGLGDNPSDGSVLLMKSLALGLSGISKAYGSKYVSVEYKEV